MWFLLIPGIAGLIVLISFLLCRYAFASPRGDQNDDHALPPFPQMEPYRETVHRMIDDLNARPYEEVYITSYDGLKLRGRYYHTADGAPLVLCFHGYRGTPSRDFSGGAAFHLDAGMNLLMIEERAQCGSQGKYITMGVRESYDCGHWIDYALERFGRGTRIILSGISMGATTVLLSAGLGLPDNVKGVIADCPFTSPGAITRAVLREYRLPVFPVYPLLALGARLFAGFRMDEADAARAVRRVETPILLIHGEDDRFVPCEMSRAIAAANPAIEFHTFPGAGHGLSFLADRQRYCALAEDFLRRVLADRDNRA